MKRPAHPEGNKVEQPSPPALATTTKHKRMEQPVKLSLLIAALLAGVSAMAGTITVNTLTADNTMVGSTDTDPFSAPLAVGGQWYSNTFSGTIRERQSSIFENRTEWYFRFDLSALSGVSSNDIQSVAINLPQIGRLNGDSKVSGIAVYDTDLDWDMSSGTKYPTWGAGTNGTLVASIADAYNYFGLTADVTNDNVEGVFSASTPELKALVFGWMGDPSSNEGLLVRFTSEENIGLAFGVPSLEITTFGTESLLSLSPDDQLAIGLTEPGTSATGTLTASFIYGGLASNDVTITSATVIDQNPVGAFSIASYPSVLTNPAPASEPITIQFTPSGASMSPGEGATGLVQIIWNGGSVTSTSTVAVSAFYDFGSLVNNFDGDDGNDVNPGFQVVRNNTVGAQAESSDPSIGLIQFSDTGSGTPTVGLVASNRVNLAAAGGFTITWEVASTSDDIRPNANGWFFGVQDGVLNTTNGNGLWSSSPKAVGMVIKQGHGVDYAENAGSTTKTTVELLPIATYTAASYTNGFTVEMTFNNDDTWSVATTGLDPEVSTNGVMTTVTYADIASSLFAASFLQSNNSVTQTVNYAYVSLVPVGGAPSSPFLKILPGTGGMYSIYGSNLTASATYTLQGATSLTLANWVDLGSTNGVTEVNWLNVVAPTNSAGFFRLSAE